MRVLFLLPFVLACTGVAAQLNNTFNVNLTVAVINNTLSIPAIFPVANTSLPYGYQYLPDSITSVITISKNSSCVEYIPGVGQATLNTDCANGTYFYTVGGNITGVNATIASIHPLYNPTLCLLGDNDTVTVEDCGSVSTGGIWWQYNPHGKQALVWQGSMNTTAAAVNNISNVTIVANSTSNVESETGWVVTDVTSNVTCLPDAKYDICLHNGTCVNHTCACPNGYEGIFCNTPKVSSITQNLQSTCGTTECTSCTTATDCIVRSPLVGVVAGSSSNILCLNGNCVCAAPQADPLECVVLCDDCLIGCFVNNGSCANDYVIKNFGSN